MGRVRTGVVALALILTACGGAKQGANGGGGNGGGGNGGQVCHPSGSALSIEAKDLTFFVDCLAAPAGEPFTIAFDNQDEGLPHNVSIQADSGALFVGDIITGPDTVTYEVEALEAGTYEFRCDVHPQMKGAFIVE